MTKVFVLHHVHAMPGSDENVKLLGVYSSEHLAKQAVSRFNKQPGFSALPDIVAPGSDDDQGFHISDYDLDQDVRGWADGYISV